MQNEENKKNSRNLLASGAPGGAERIKKIPHLGGFQSTLKYNRGMVI